VNLGGVHKAQGDLVSAERDIRESIEMFRRLGSNRTQISTALYSLGLLLVDQKRFAEVVPVLEEAISIRASAPDSDPGAVAVMRTTQGRTLTRLKRFPEAEKALLAAHQTLAAPTDSKRPTSPRATLEALIELYDAWGRKDEATRYRSELEALGGVKS
jgi:tetratricopeptide (TPR) repeat protein